MVATTEATEWRGRVLPAGTGILIFAPFFHRDGDRLPFAETFRPAIWLHGEAVDWPLVPFSQGPAECPAAASSSC